MSCTFEPARLKVYFNKPMQEPEEYDIVRPVGAASRTAASRPAGAQGSCASIQGPRHVVGTVGTPSYCIEMVSRITLIPQKASRLSMKRYHCQSGQSLRQDPRVTTHLR